MKGNMKHSRMIKQAKLMKRSKKVLFSDLYIVIDAPKEKTKKRKKALNVIIEGGDCSGKTTIFNELIKNIPQDMVYRVSKPDCFLNALDSTVNQLHHLKDDVPMFFERSFISELIYGKRFRKYTPDQERVFRQLLKEIPENTVIFIITSPDKTLMERYQQRGDSFVDATNILQINKEYLELVIYMREQTNARIIVVNNNSYIASAVEAMQLVIDDYYK